jgi:hypothetical protein
MQQVIERKNTKKHQSSRFGEWSGYLFEQYKQQGLTDRDAFLQVIAKTNPNKNHKYK